MKKLSIITLCVLGLIASTWAQTATQTVRGEVTDYATGEALFGATVVLVGSEPIVGSPIGIDGTFTLENIPVGRHSFEFRMIGYENQTISEVLVSTGKELVLNIRLKEQVSSLNEVVVVYKAAKTGAINDMAPVSSRQFTVEETQRYAGGLNDPARLVSSFAGVASPSISSNGISVRGNSPSGLLWRIEGVEIPSPNHFADLSIAGAGVLTAMSSQVMSNSDFFTGAFPAEYGNATSGVFDINLRSGNATKREHTAQIGVLGVDFATEGPFKMGNKATYLANYRYSTLALISPFLPSDAGILKYQDLSYNINMPTEKSGDFSLWGIGVLDGVDIEDADSTQWTPESDRENSQTSMFMFASGVNHKLSINSKAMLNSSLAISGSGLNFKEQFIGDQSQEIPVSDASRSNYKLTLQSSLATYLGKKHYNKSGFYINGLMYDLDLKHAEDEESPLDIIADEKGQSALFQMFSQSQVNLSSRLTMNAGLHSQYFVLNEELTLEPRISFDYNLTDKSKVALAYGLHSKAESLGFYFIKDQQGNEPNRNLKLMKSHHWVFSYNTQLFDNMRLTIEPYYQYLFDIPIALDGYVSTINNQDNLFFEEVLNNGGTGRNMGVDFTLERYLNNGFYSLLTTSVFDSKYTANDGIERNTRLNKNFVLNAVAGKEWQVGREKNNTLSVNLRLNYLGGNRVEAIDLERSLERETIIHGETNGELSYSERHKATPIYSFTLTYRKNKPRHSSIWSLQVLNASGTTEFDGYVYNSQNQTFKADHVGIVIPNLSYKIEF